jgi:hypothetical protein
LINKVKQELNLTKKARSCPCTTSVVDHIIWYQEPAAAAIPHISQHTSNLNPALPHPCSIMTTPPPPKPKTTDEQIAELRAVIDNMAASMATMQGNQGQLTTAINWLQSAKVGDGSDAQPSRDPIMSAAKHGHKLLFPTYDGTDDPLPWLNWCDQFFRIQQTQDTGKVFLASFYMTSDAAQWFTVVERNRGTPTWEEFTKLVNQRFGHLSEATLWVS